jgi:5,10-methylenetetrahydrofolate reductase
MMKRKEHVAVAASRCAGDLISNSMNHNHINIMNRSDITAHIMDNCTSMIHTDKH